MIYDDIVLLFRSSALLTQALTHASASDLHNERLEFLGDRVLGLAIASLLEHHFPTEKEGDLAKRFAGLVCTETLADIAHKIKLIDKIKVGSWDLKKSLKDQIHMHANTMEALLGALYLDRGFDITFEVINTLWTPLLHEMKNPPQDAKSQLQEYIQKEIGEIPVYTLIEKSGKEHAPIFTVNVTAMGKTASGTGSTKKEAEQNAAAKWFEQP